ncbi:MAG: hypothetical protein JXM68_04725 [Sedimentisphaerales bacterium]|nr:hypothetical protein [Sedimentisphaerales bacterium]
MDKTECSTCPHNDKCRDVWSEENRGPLSPMGLALSSAIAFLLPLFTAILAGSIGKAYEASLNVLVLLVFAGLLAGVAVATLLVFILKKRIVRQPENCPSASNSESQEL